MAVHELYNLYMGDHCPESWGTREIGPFRVRLVSDYQERVKRLYRQSWRSESVDLETGESTITDHEGHPGEWTVTATAEEIGEGQSVLYKLIDDKGLSDLNAILTFCTGRRVTTGDQLNRYLLTSNNAYACKPLETLEAAELAWSAREALVESGLHNVLSLHNEALTLSLVQASVPILNAALEIILSKLDLGAPKLSKAEKRRRAALRAEMKSAVGGAIDRILELDDRAKEGYKARLGSTIDGGLGGSVDRFQRLLVSFGIVDDPPSVDAFRRIRYFNTIRNRLVHQGEVPHLVGLQKEQSDATFGAIAIGILPRLIKLVVGKALGFRSDGLGSYCQHVDEYRKYFMTGVWRGHPVEKHGWEEWQAMKVPSIGRRRPV